MAAVIRAVKRWYWGWCLIAIEDERAHWFEIGLMPGPEYWQACDEQVRDLRSRIAMLDVVTN